MKKAHDLLQELRRSGNVHAEQLQRFLELCKERAVPEVTLYTTSGMCEGWYEMFRIFVFSARPDVHDFVWYHSHRRGLLVFTADGSSWKPLEEWDPDADIFFDESRSDGGTNMTPFEREASSKTG
ncbi:MAG: hypothetical protein ABIG71_02420 [Candidatus Uhrbacteria bacterium]